MKKVLTLEVPLGTYNNISPKKEPLNKLSCTWIFIRYPNIFAGIRGMVSVSHHFSIKGTNQGKRSQRLPSTFKFTFNVYISYEISPNLPLERSASLLTRSLAHGQWSQKNKIPYAPVEFV